MSLTSERQKKSSGPKDKLSKEAEKPPEGEQEPRFIPRGLPADRLSDEPCASDVRGEMNEDGSEREWNVAEEVEENGDLHVVCNLCLTSRLGSFLSSTLSRSFDSPSL